MPTIKDVAQLAGVGVGTASRVLSGRGSFSAKAAARVASAVQTLDFRPSTIARALVTQVSGTIGVYVPDFKGPFYGPMLHAVESELRSHERHMVAANGCGQASMRRQAQDGVRFLMDRGCDGILVTTNALTDADLLALQERFPHVAVVNREVVRMKAACFSVDHHAAGRLAGRAFLDHGHRQLAVIAGLAEAPDNRQRLQGFFDELATAGIAREQVPCVDGLFTAKGGSEATGALLAGGAQFTGLFCCNDLMAMGAIARLHAAGKRMPEEVSVIGYDDADEMAAYLSPSLTSIRIAIDNMGLNACRMLLNQCYAMSLPLVHEFQPELVLRNSLGPAPG
ncbi:substrate-binding domain-containing protein [Ideonella azotifigens]|uniref:LacI family DNA-binding transcriptional regulator n=1 Tax=Ideonella azotifigens TaxID=513160 RepID=A0ABN1KL78_9BURK|nr:substrate-binding domain-containing protein [Ideonella azotifigens]MCD2344791.1 substrate-binding domain-containing protein [Ideonella azotifigens]